jgi:hypothetical protein
VVFSAGISVSVVTVVFPELDLVCRSQWNVKVDTQDAKLSWRFKHYAFTNGRI